ncbi:DNA replication and repair protein RecN [Roseiarcus fermentans]|uniref:DNA repair protein RecN n=1 Tax=Roseiarcus fermentans TaxID=1473586 RepID=A0A366FWV0_9HYPH|nr:DNA repair protein RecN [Roseiarcus fermentans]RBP18215.1 DNA replication and repair protein RecN [Roseiarcus fermentans]
MLARLSIRDVVLIDQLDLEFSSGLTILTGETGAGKSILLDALSLALGARGDGGLVRHGQTQGQVVAVFELPAGHAAHALLEGQDIEIGDQLILRRVQLADGRTRAYVNDQSVSVQALRSLASSLVEIHGQHDERALTDPATHRALVDSYGRLEPQARATQEAHAAMRAVESALDAERRRVAAAEAEADFARHAHDELVKLAVRPGEEEELSVRRQAMMQGEKVAADIREARDHLTGDAAILPMLVSVSRRLQRRMSQAPGLIEPSVKALDEALEALEGAARAVEDALEASAFDPHELERCEERLFALRAMSRKHGRPIDGLPALAQKYADDLAALDAGRDEVARLESEAALVRERYHAAARALSAARRQSARELETAVTAELPPLKLERAEFRVEVTADEALASPTGYDRAEFLVRTNPGARPGPMMKVASGGELSRFLLAIKVCLAERGTAPTLVFDEIDAGVGGAVADAMGQRLARLAARAQVLAVTHAPQVAARARRHLKIVKSDVGAGERVVTSVSALEAAERREEIARMLAGAQITREARAAAASLIEKAG